MVSQKHMISANLEQCSEGDRHTSIDSYAGEPVGKGSDVGFRTRYTSGCLPMSGESGFRGSFARYTPIWFRAFVVFVAMWLCVRLRINAAYPHETP